ncbi:hypothetical protein L8S23_21395 [Enterobacter bugandensis]|uniref:hypothetical protein n=1 Tax=Enterobacter bugandensis TaxID=881260 RepID=UPI002003292F|nr:hypothetical protein [Enterobacter bugandensis]MCK6879733.1 hypothetical protein [Enterobacter bugandensis]
MLADIDDLENDENVVSSTEVATVTALVVSSLAVLACVALNRVPDTALGLYFGAWVTHAGVQRHQRLKGQADPAAVTSPSPDAGDIPMLINWLLTRLLHGVLLSALLGGGFITRDIRRVFAQGDHLMVQTRD